MAIRLLRMASGIVFVVFGAAKFTQHETEVDSFRSYGLPEPDVLVYAVGALEIAGGLMLIAGLLLWPVALALAGNMVGAIVVSGIGEGEVVPSLTVAPALLAVMVLLLRRERPRVRARRGGPRSPRRA